MENFPNRESKSSPIEVPATLIKLIQEKGLGDAEVLTAINGWTVIQEQVVLSLPRPEPEIRFTMARVELYLAAGDREGALECLEDARCQADQEGCSDLYQKIMDLLDNLERSESHEM
ncbi:MAG: hypothetical protein A2589_01320 [Candidatus Vogelbacteria bacterium RIFOXYD1_FULL_46_19]|uniref:Uncharacterized protein n=1 Tax=Candidatus Vogelbacteria bacterium RIFOXYD1_FULL_46_19 TaxID=1802439 RepID=A0A1G2QFT1_9BACT|nr:MAG: hypothetical protein A2589_01320 [Candidatus Vogelbacteria bacterium RIFOXYD1_FULL_46_19]